ncbi:MAG: hypothetical protein RI935_205 [Candidatus Parcubacteria bacterium]|jgi:hypothetical protein
MLGMFIGDFFMSYKLKVQNAALDEIKGSIVLRGVIDPATFSDIKIGDYQREEGSLKDLDSLIKALKAGDQLPDIEIGIRGNDYSERDGVFYIPCDSYVVDGLQRLTAAKPVWMEDPKIPIRLGALLHFGSNEAWERERFKLLDTLRRKVSPNVLLRNEKDSPAVSALIAMSNNDKDFALKAKVCWGQKMARTEMVTALTVLKTVSVLHSHLIPGMASHLSVVVAASDKALEFLGPNV